MALRDRIFGSSRTNATRKALADKVIAITGGARGIGFTTATMLIESGATVAIGDIDDEAVGKAAADLGIDGHPVDVSDRDSFEKFLDAVEDSLGPIDVLINNAGIMPVGPFLDFDDTIIRRAIDIDLYGVMVGTQLAVRRMVGRGHGQVVNMASVAGRVPTPGMAVYNGVKAGVIEFSEALDAELESTGVRVSAVLPTFTRTELISGIETNALIQTIGPEEVAAQVISIIVKPRVRVAAPASMGWVDLAPVLGKRFKRSVRRVTKLDSVFLRYDTDQRSAYVQRIRGEE